LKRKLRRQKKKKIVKTEGATQLVSGVVTPGGTTDDYKTGTLFKDAKPSNQIPPQARLTKKGKTKGGKGSEVQACTYVFEQAGLWVETKDWGEASFSHLPVQNQKHQNHPT